MGQPILQRCDRLDHVEALTRAGGAGDDGHAAMAKAEGFQDFVAHLHLFHGSAERETRIVSPIPIQSRLPRPMGGFDRAGHQAARFGDAEVDGGIRRASASC